MAFKKNKVKVDLCSYPPYMFLAPKKFGKTTFWYNLVRDAWGDDDKGLLISFGNEEGYHSLDGIQVEVAKEWDSDYDEETELRGFVQIVDDIIDNNHEYGLKGVCFDTLDTMVDVATKEVLRQHKKEKGTVCKTLNEAFSGYGRGKARLLTIMNEQIGRLRDAGLAVFILCHIKNKEKTDLMSGEKYEQITNNLTDDIYSNFADAAQMVMVGALDREIVAGKIISDCANVSSDACGLNNSLINIGGYWWTQTWEGATTGTAVTSTRLLYAWTAYSKYMFAANSAAAYGIRPVVYLDESIVVTGGSGTAASPYTISTRS